VKLRKPLMRKIRRVLVHPKEMKMKKMTRRIQTIQMTLKIPSRHQMKRRKSHLPRSARLMPNQLCL
jgi:hypothetical protein